MKINCRDGDTAAGAMRGQAGLSAPCGGRGLCGKCKIRAVSGKWEPPTAQERQQLTAEELRQGVRLACQARGKGLCEVEPLWHTGGMSHILGAREGCFSGSLRREMAGRYGFAADLGTTTVVIQVWGPEGKLLGEQAAPNPQRTLGADVISRIERALGGGLPELQRLAAGCIGALIEAACRQAGISPDALAEGVVVGNTAMLTLLTGNSPKALAAFPFLPDELFGRWYTGKELGLSCGRARVYLPRCVAGYVGADADAAALASGLDTPGPARLLADIGTNGEMFLAAEGRLLCCSAAAGPAFEGVGISCGMPGTDGALYRVFLQSNCIKWECLGFEAPSGICGSGLLDTAAVWKRMGCLDETGLLLQNGQPASALEIGDSGVRLTQKDIRSLQLAKSAIRAGQETLLLRAGVLPAQVEALYLAGGFGSRLNPESAGEIGLIPPVLSGRAEAVGNGALKGAAEILLGEGARQRAQKISEAALHLELSADPDFMDLYMEHMMF